MPRNYLSIAVIIIAALVGGAVFVWPKYQKLDLLKKDIEMKGMELQSKTDYFNYIRTTFEELKNYEESFSKVSTALPGKEPLLPATFNFLQRTASQSGVILETLSVGSAGKLKSAPAAQTGAPPAPASGTEAAAAEIKTVDMAFGVSGSYGSLKLFLDELESSARIFEIKRIDFSSPAEDESFTFNVSVSIHYY